MICVFCKVVPHLIDYGPAKIPISTNVSSEIVEVIFFLLHSLAGSSLRNICKGIDFVTIHESITKITSRVSFRRMTVACRREGVLQSKACHSHICMGFLCYYSQSHHLVFRPLHDYLQWYSNSTSHYFSDLSQIHQSYKPS